MKDADYWDEGKYHPFGGNTNTAVIYMFLQMTMQRSVLLCVSHRGCVFKCNKICKNGRTLKKPTSLSLNMYPQE